MPGAHDDPLPSLDSGARGRQALSRYWPTLRALLIALAIAAGMIDGAPIPTPKVMLRLSPALRVVSLRLYALQDQLLEPVRPIKQAFSINQRWGLFSTTGPLRYRMWIEARRAGEPWALLYRAQDTEHAFMSDTLEFRRVRNTWNPNRRGAKPSYPAFAWWIARQIFLARPGFDEARVRMERVMVQDHGKGRESTGDFEYVLVRTRAEVLE